MNSQASLAEEQKCLFPQKNIGSATYPAGKSVYHWSLSFGAFLWFRFINYMGYEITIYSSLTPGLESLREPDRSFLVLPQPVKLTGIPDSWPMNNFYLLRCTPQSSKLCSEHVAFPLSQRHIPVGACTAETLSEPKYLCCCLSICNCCSHIILTYHPHSSAKLSFQIAGTMRNLRRLHLKIFSQYKCEKKPMKMKSWFKVSGWSARVR